MSSTEAPQYQTLTSEEVLKLVQSNPATGLTRAEAAARFEKHGPNELPKPEQESIWEKIKEQFEDLLVRILCLAAVISFAISLTEKEEEHAVPGWVEPLVIFSILVLNAVVGIYQDYDAEKAIEALKDLQSIDALVLRDGQWIRIPSREVVPGDIVQIQQGDKVPADLRIVEIKTASIRLEQSILTGESQAVLKTTDPVKKPEATISEKHNIVFSGTLVSSGNAIGVTITTGAGTEMGKINEDIQDTENEDTPLKKRLEEFGETLAKVIGVICVLVWIINFRNFSDPVHGGFVRGCLYYFKVAVALAVAAIPEGLPAVTTTCLALGTRRMAKERAIIRKLPSVETLGCTTVICSDKTGTLTTNEMVVKEILLYGDSVDTITQHEVTGISYQPEGDVKNVRQGEISQNAALRRLCECMVLNNDAKLLMSQNKVTRSGLPTEAALKVLVEKLAKYDNANLASSGAEAYGEYLTKDYTKAATLEFTRDRKSMSVIARNKNGKDVLFIKGAPDYLINGASGALLKNGSVQPLNAESKKQLIARVNNLAQKGLRTLALCYKEDLGKLAGYNGPKHPAHALLADPEKYGNFETDPVVIGIVAIQDPPRPEVAESIKQCRRAGISVIMITGDIKETAQAIGKEIGIVGSSDVENYSFTGVEFEKLSEQKQQEVFNRCIKTHGGLLFSRTEPKHKKILVQALSGLNQIVAMTGDGVNDAPALKQAHIGIAMGINGTEVAKESADMVLADDNFSTIVKAVEEGRAIFANMKAFIRYMISSNIGEVVSILLSSILGIPDGFNSIQLLWVNLVTDGFPATALSFNPPDPQIMKKPPRKHDEPIITSWVFFRYLVIGTYVGLATVGIFTYWYIGYDWSGDGHSLVKFGELANWSECSNWQGFSVANYGKYTQFKTNPCSYFTVGKQKASTLSLTVLVVIEMFNALNALSEDSSLLQIGIFANPWLLVAIFLSMALHCVILYIPLFGVIFGTVPLNSNDWLLVLMFSFPVFIVEEVLKFVNRQRNKAAIDSGKKEI